MLIANSLHYSIYTFLYAFNCMHYSQDYFQDFLKQVHAGCGRHVPGYLKLFLCGHLYVCVCVCVCPLPRLLITSGVMWHDMDLISLVK